MRVVYEFDYYGRIKKVIAKKYIGSLRGDSVCNCCGKTMRICWDTVCKSCNGTFCYNCSIIKEDHWFCKPCNQRQNRRFPWLSPFLLWIKNIIKKLSFLNKI